MASPMAATELFEEDRPLMEPQVTTEPLDEDEDRERGRLEGLPVELFDEYPDEGRSCPRSRSQMSPSSHSMRLPPPWALSRPYTTSPSRSSAILSPSTLTVCTPPSGPVTVVAFAETVTLVHAPMEPRGPVHEPAKPRGPTGFSNEDKDEDRDRGMTGEPKEVEEDDRDTGLASSDSMSTNSRHGAGQRGTGTFMSIGDRGGVSVPVFTPVLPASFPIAHRASRPASRPCFPPRTAIPIAHRASRLLSFSCCRSPELRTKPATSGDLRLGSFIAGGDMGSVEVWSFFSCQARQGTCE